ncbi:hypothetical protein OIDMADRAFT_23789 [Oidiodendron maius Zn]|uniref:AMP-dependent synthetase/ligase domain-containing protein n=1 Tax=Oidiodendron maius (strain Zn) TaxID=913774 RepID=A0A0C3E3Y0_OIDMZ|nr:hypothetical protein OIDMADRAFT_23789 [Oidiodendron maius Zn]
MSDTPRMNDGDDLEPRLLLHYIHQTAAQDPGRVCVSLPILNNPEDGFRDITLLQFEQAIDYAARWMERHVGRGRSYQTLAYIGPQDSWYLILILAALKTGWKLFAPSPRNSFEAYVKLLHSYECKVFFYSKEHNIGP